MSEPLPGLLRRLLEEHQILLPLQRWLEQLPEAEPSAAGAELERLAGEPRGTKLRRKTSSPSP